jgi:hypothetical protein
MVENCTELPGSILHFVSLEISMIGGVADPEDHGGVNEIAFEAYGVCLAAGSSDPSVLDRMRHFLPPGWKPCPASAVEERFILVSDDAGRYALTHGDEALAGTQDLDLDLALDIFDSQLRIYLGRKAPDAIFVHAGVVSHSGSAIVIPAPSFGGKTTLVAALVRAGAVYYSDEFAVIDRNGLVQPYAKPLSLRGDGWVQSEHSVESLGGLAGDEPLPLGMIVITTYRAGAEWSPKRLSAGAGALALLENAVPARERPEEVMQTISRAAKTAAVIKSDRGEADAIAPLLIQELQQRAG